MKTEIKLLTIMTLIIMALSGCAKKEESLEERKERINREAELLKMNEIKSQVPDSEIVARIKDRDMYIHKIYDEKKETTCYFISTVRKTPSFRSGI